MDAVMGTISERRTIVASILVATLNAALPYAVMPAFISVYGDFGQLPTLALFLDKYRFAFFAVPLGVLVTWWLRAGMPDRNRTVVVFTLAGIALADGILLLAVLLTLGKQSAAIG